jgi:hypothetical protein
MSAAFAVSTVGLSGSTPAPHTQGHHAAAKTARVVTRDH